MSNLYREPSIDASYQVSFHLAKRFQRRRFLEIEQFGLAVSEKIFRNQPIRNKNCLWQPCLLMDQDEISNLNRRLSIDASYQVSIHPKQELPVAAMFVHRSGRNEQSLERTFHRYFLPSFSSFDWGVSEGKIKMWKVKDDRRRTPSDCKSSHCLWQGELKNCKN